MSVSHPIFAAAFAFVLLVGASSAEAQGVLDDPRLGASRTAIAAAVAAARTEGLPEAFILDKVAEGLSKGVPPERIAGAVDRLLTHMRAAHEIVTPVRGGDRRTLLRAGLDAIAAGAPIPRLRALVREVGFDSPVPVQRSLVTVAELTERGFTGASSVEATSDAYRGGRLDGLRDLLVGARRLHGGNRDEGLRQLGREVRARDVDRGGPSRDPGSRGPRR